MSIYMFLPVIAGIVGGPDREAGHIRTISAGKRKNNELK